MNGPQDDEEDFSKLPLDERLLNKSWKARLNGYQQLLKQFQNGFPLPQEYVKYWSDPGLFHKYILDSNVVAQENALSALHALLRKQIPNVESSFKLEPYLNEWVGPLVSKALNSSRNKSKELSVTCILLLCSLDHSISAIVTMIIEILPTMRIPKLIAAIILCLNTILSTFQLINVEGSGLIELLNKIFGPLPKLASHADKNVRGNTMDLIVTLYILLGKDQSLLQETLLDKLKPIQQRELEKRFNSSDIKLMDPFKDCETNDIIMFEWQRKAQQEAMESLHGEDNEVDADGDTNMGINIADSSLGTKIDPLQLLPEEDLLNNLPDEFHNRIKSNKWKDRVEVLEELNLEHLQKIKKLKIREDYGPILKILSDIIHRDVNVQCVTLASDIVNQILTKLPHTAIHENYISMIFPALLERTKERKPSVIEMIIKTIHTVCSIYDPFVSGHESLILRDLLIKLNDRIPGVRLECSKILNELLGSCLTMDVNYMINNLIDGLKIQGSLLKLINDTQVNIRNVSFMIVAKLMNLLGGEYFQDFLDGIDKLKRRKIEAMISGDEGAVKFKGKLKSKVVVKPSAPSRMDTQQQQPVINSHNNNNTNNRLNKIIPNKRVATSPAVKMQRSPVKISNRNMISPRSVIQENSNSNNNREEIISLQKRVKELESENMTYKKKNTDLERVVNQHIQTIMMKDTEIQKLKRQYEVMVNEYSYNSGISSITNHQPQIDTHAAQPQLEINAHRNIIKSSPISRDLPNKVRRLQLDPHSDTNNLNLNINANANAHSNNGSKFASNDVVGRRQSTATSQDVVNTTVATEESWQRAAQVTQQLKDRINRMRNRR